MAEATVAAVGTTKDAKAASKAEQDEEAAAATLVAARMAEDDVAAGAAKEDTKATATSSFFEPTVPNAAKGGKKVEPYSKLTRVATFEL